MSSELISQNSDTGIALAYAKLEIESLMEHAKHDKRDIKVFLKEATDLATCNEEIAASCIFSLPRKIKNEKTGKYEQGYIRGKSIRLAEIIFSVYKNIKVDVRIAREGDKTVTAIASCIDLQNKTFFSEEAIANVNGTHGDARKLAMGVAKSIAVRNAIFRLVPGALSESIYKEAVKCAVGNQETFPLKRKAIFERIAKLGISKEKIFAFYKKKAIEEFTPENMEEIVGIGSAIKEGQMKIDEAFTETLTPDEVNEGVNDLIAKKSNISVEKKADEQKETEVLDTDTGEVIQPQTGNS
jgi:hypothetical protein